MADPIVTDGEQEEELEELTSKEQEEEEGAEQTKSPRDIAMQAVVDAVEAEDEGVDTHPAEKEMHDEMLSNQETPTLEGMIEPETEVVEEPEKSNPVYLNDAGEYVMDLKINNTIVTRKLDSIVASEQKSEAGSIKLQQAAQERSELDAYAQQLAEYAEALKNQPPVTGAGEDQLSIDAEQQAISIVEKIQDGDESAGKELALLFARRQEQPIPQIDEQAVLSLAQQAVLESEERADRKHFEQSQQAGIKWLHSNHPEVAEDAELTNFINAQTIAVMQDSPEMRPEDVIKEATDQVLSRLKRNQPSNRLAGKKQIIPTIKGRGAKHKTPAKKEVDTSALGVIERMRAQRHRLRGNR